MPYELTDITTDHFWDGRLTLCQPKTGPRCAIDALLLAMAVQPQPGQCVFEAGSGNGIVSLSIALENPAVQVTGLEIQDCLYALSQKNKQLNGLSNIEFLHGDLTQPLTSLKKLGLGCRQFDQVVANPPYYIKSESRVSNNAVIRQAYSADEETLERWMRFLASITKEKGCITLIHRAEMLEKLLKVMDGRFGDIKIFPVYPRKNLPAKRIILQGVKGSRASATLYRGLVLHDKKEGYSAEAANIIHHGNCLWS